MVAQPWDYNKNDRIVYFKRVNFMGCESFLKDFRFIRKHETFQNNTPRCYLLGSSHLPVTQPLGPAAPMPFFQLRTWELRAGKGPVRTALLIGARGAMGSKLDSWPRARVLLPSFPGSAESSRLRAGLL